MSNSIGQGGSMPTIGTLNQGAIQYVNNPLQSPQLQSTSLQGSPSQHSPMGTQSQVGSKVGQIGGGDQTIQVNNLYLFADFVSLQHQIANILMYL